MKQHRVMSLTSNFMKWIERFNECSIERKKLFCSSQHWFENTVRKFYNRWIEQVKINQHHRSLVRQTVPMRCLLRMILSRVPLIECDIGHELFFATQFYQMKEVNQERILISVQDFKHNLKASIFQKLKSNYHRMCRFKAGVAIRMAVDCLGGWKSEVSRKVAKRNAVKAMRNQIGKNLFANIMWQWSCVAKYKKFLAENEGYIQRQNLRGQKRVVLYGLRDFSHQQNEKT